MFFAMGNQGAGFRSGFAIILISAFHGFYSSFGEEDIAESPPIEKLSSRPRLGRLQLGHLAPG
jgi:hypothetical protein